MGFSGDESFSELPDGLEWEGETLGFPPDGLARDDDDLTWGFILLLLLLDKLPLLVKPCLVTGEELGFPMD